MKTLLLICAFFSIAALTHAQSPDQKYVYCQIVGTQKFLSPNKVTITIDFGEEKNYWKDNRVREEETGKVKVFNSMVDALNYMGAHGWEFVQAYIVTISNQNVYHYLLKRPAE